jgi:hypothetical protein
MKDEKFDMRPSQWDWDRDHSGKVIPPPKWICFFDGESRAGHLEACCSIEDTQMSGAERFSWTASLTAAKTIGPKPIEDVYARYREFDESVCFSASGTALTKKAAKKDACAALHVLVDLVVRLHEARS